MPPKLYCHFYGSVLKEVLSMLMNVCLCSLGVTSMVDDMDVDGSFNVLVVCMLFLLSIAKKQGQFHP